MGNGMNKIITGVYVGNFRDAKDQEQLDKHSITHILAIHDNAKPLLKDKEYLCIVASDTPDQGLAQFFPECIEFIHKARLEKGNVLIHCLAGVSRSVTVTAAYIMTVTKLGWRDTLNAIRGARSCANPNFGFQKQLQEYDNESLPKEREALKVRFPDNPFEDDRECECLLKSFRQFVATGESRGPELYSLPHKAYENRNKRNKDKNTATNDAASSANTGDTAIGETGNASNKLLGNDGASSNGVTDNDKGSGNMTDIACVGTGADNGETGNQINNGAENTDDAT